MYHNYHIQLINEGLDYISIHMDLQVYIPTLFDGKVPFYREIVAMTSFKTCNPQESDTSIHMFEMLVRKS